MMNACEMVERCAQRQVRVVSFTPLSHGCLQQAPPDVQCLSRTTYIWSLNTPNLPNCQAVLMSIKEDHFELTEAHQHGLRVG